MENIVRTAINSMLSSFIEPIGDESLTVTREDGFVIKDVNIDQIKVNQYLEDHFEGRVRVDDCHLKEVRVAFDWSEAAAVIEIDNLTFALMPRVGRLVKKKVLGCFDMREEEDELEARYKGRFLYDPSWNNQANVVRHTMQYCPNCACDLRRFRERAIDFPSPPLEPVASAYKQQIASSIPGGKRLYGLASPYREEAARMNLLSRGGALYDDIPIENSDGIQSNYSPADSHLYRPPAYPQQRDGGRINRRKKQINIGCSSLIDNIREQLDPIDGIPHSYIADAATDPSTLLTSQNQIHRGGSNDRNYLDYTAIADKGKQFNKRPRD